MFFIFMLFLEVKTCKYIHIHKQIPPNDHDGSTRKVWMGQWDTYFKRQKSTCFEFFFLNSKGFSGANQTEKNIIQRHCFFGLEISTINFSLMYCTSLFQLSSEFCPIFPDFFTSRIVLVGGKPIVVWGDLKDRKMVIMDMIM